ncbi:hypothetical protein HOY82DRAFT_615985 [Tuber indicum]|nr:hypothetical protein HOY82DRAFT_615985 [Tuber indicum]
MNAFGACEASQAAMGVSSDSMDVPLLLRKLLANSALDPKVRSGRPALLSKEDKDRLIVFIKRDFYTRRIMMIDVQREAGFLHEKQLEYCQDRELWLPNREWANYRFTDERAIEVGAGLEAQCVWREKGERWKNYYVGSKKKFAILVMCWGAIVWNWKGPFYVWQKESKEEKVTAVEAVKECNKKAEEKEQELNTAWRGTEEWVQL